MSVVDMDGRPLDGLDRPFNEDAERAVLGAILLHDGILDEIGDILEPEHFMVGVHGRIYEQARNLAGSARAVSPTAMMPYFQGDESLAEVGGPAYFARLLPFAATPRQVGDYARQVRDFWMRRELILMTEDARAVAYKEPGADEQADWLENALFDLRASRQGGEAVSALDAYDSLLSQADALHRGETSLVTTGLSELDRLIRGLGPGDVMVLAGRPAMGKSAAAQAITRYNLDQGVPVGWLQMEMSREQMMAREVSHLIDTPADIIQSGQMNTYEWQEASAVRAKLAKLPLYIDDRRGVGIDQLIPRARRMVRRHGIGLLVIDYMGLVRFGKTGRYEGITDVSQRVKELAGVLKIPVLALHQLSRANETRSEKEGGKRPQMSDIRDSGAVEQDADKIVFVHREEYYLARAEPDPDDADAHGEWRRAMDEVRGRAELIVAKNRQGETGIARCRFIGRTTTFTD